MSGKGATENFRKTVVQGEESEEGSEFAPSL